MNRKGSGCWYFRHSSFETDSDRGRNFIGWWKVNPTTGTTLAVTERGWGDAGVEGDSCESRAGVS